MLKTMREGSAFFVKGVMLFVVITFVGTIFVVWGVKSAPGDLGRRGVVAVVGDREIMADEVREAVRRQEDYYKQLLGDKFDEKLLQALNVRQQVLEGLIRRALVLQYAEHNGLAVSWAEVDDTFREIPAFKGSDGQYSKQRAEDILRANRVSADRVREDLRADLTVRNVQSLVAGSVKVSEAEARQRFDQMRRQLTVEVAELPAGDDGKKIADAITVDVGKGKSLADAAKGAGKPVKTLGPFPVTAPPKDIPDPDVFRQAAAVLQPGEMSPLVSGQKASYLLKLVSVQPPTQEEFDKEKATFETQLLSAKREMVLSDWFRELRRQAKVTVEGDAL
jgi:hypothetical protein